MRKSLTLLAVFNVALGLFAAFALFIFIGFFGVSDDIDRSKIAWGHEAVDRFVGAFYLTCFLAPLPLIGNWCAVLAITGSARKATLFTLRLSTLVVAFALCAAAISCIQFYIEKPIAFNSKYYFS